jgi:hypothetical protein
VAGAEIATASAPNIRPLERISPSLGEDLRTCGLRVAYRLDPRFDSFRRLRPAAAIGLVSHELAEAVINGEFDAISGAQLEEGLAQEWKRRIALKADELAKEWPLGTVPPPERWAGYQLARVRLLRRLAEEVRRRRARSAGLAAPQAEAWLEAPEIPLVGRIDRVERRNGEVGLVDLKTGWTVDEEVRPAHRTQLLLYAYLWHAVHGEWPATVSIQRLDGLRSTLEVVPGEAERVAAELIARVAEFNRRVSADDPPGVLASPSPEACAHCDFRALCPPFFAALSEGWGWYRRALLGDLVRAAGDGGNVLEIAVEASNLASEVTVARVLGIPSALGPPIGSHVAVVDAIPTPVPSDVRAAWDTQLLVAESEPGG